jgi:hypothetical protein
VAWIASGVEKDRRRRHVAAFHQVDEIDDQFLGALDRESGDEQGAFRACGVAHLGCETLAALLRRRCRANPVAIGRFRNQIVEIRRRLRVGLEQFRVGADIA